MILRTSLAVGIASVVLGSVVACGGGDPSISAFNQEENSSGGTPSSSSGSSGTLGTSGGPSSGTSGNLGACAIQTAEAVPKPVYLVFMFDKSGSMVQYGSPKWDSSKTATKAFFESSDSKGISASLSFFPDQENFSCSESAYTTPTVPITALPSAAFGTQLDAQDPAGGTPTYQAMAGAVAYAKTVQAGEGKDGTVAIVLVTDGLPEANCQNTSIPAVKALASNTALVGINTYVIGVGDALTNLNDIASGGGTTKALIVSPSSPAQIQKDFTAAINAIKSSAVSCDYAIPAAPANASFDRAKVNVQHTDGNGAASTISYSQACTDGTGWKYDDANSPTRIVLCDASCTAIKGTPGKVDILFGCATQVK